MSSAAQTQALRNYRKRLAKRGMARFEVLGLAADRELVRNVAKRLAEDTPEAAEIRASLSKTIAHKSREKGGVLVMLQSWPIGELELKRPFVKPRKIDL